ncbi:MAG: proline racemase family protein [Planctomycetota bacterium JB042]
MTAFEPPPSFTRLRTIDAHAAGEPLRVVVDGWPELEGRTILEKRRCARERHDDLRRALMLEPRGHADMYGCLLVAPETDDGDVGVLFLHNEGYSTMCGHGIVGLVTVGLECGLLPDRDELRIDTPAGRVTARAARRGRRVESVSFENVPSFLHARDVEVDVEGVGRLRVDVAYGGAFYAVVDAERAGVALDRGSFARIVDVGTRIKRAVAEAVPLVHPSGAEDLGFLYGTILVAPGAGDAHSRNVCVFADGEVDRSPTGTGVSARAAIHHARGELPAGEWITIESLIGTRFDVRVARETRCGAVEAIVPEVRGRAWLTGRHEFWIDPDDPLRDGVLLR